MLYTECKNSTSRLKKCFKSQSSGQLSTKIRDNIQLADVKSIRTRQNQRLRLECRHPFRPLNVKIQWLVDGLRLPDSSSVYYVDRLFRLIIEKVDSRMEKLNFTCMVEGEPQVIYLLNVKTSRTENFISYSTYFLTSFIFASLIILVYFTAKLKPNI